MYPNQSVPRSCTIVTYTHFRLKSKITVPFPTVMVGFSVLSTPKAQRTFAIVCLTQSFSVFASSGWASLHLVTMLAVPRSVSSASSVVSSEKLKNWSPSVSMPSRSHSRRWNCETGKSVPKRSSSKSHGRIRSSYRSRDSRFGGSS